MVERAIRPNFVLNHTSTQICLSIGSLSSMRSLITVALADAKGGLTSWDWPMATASDQTPSPATTRIQPTRAAAHRARRWSPDERRTLVTWPDRRATAESRPWLAWPSSAAGACLTGLRARVRLSSAAARPTDRGTPRCHNRALVGHLLPTEDRPLN